MVDGNIHVVDSTHANYAILKQKLAEEAPVEEIRKLLDIKQGVEALSDGKLTIKHGHIYFQDQEIPNSLSSVLFAIISTGSDISPFVRFVLNMMENPSKRATVETVVFLDNKNLPITDDGCFLAYKSVRSDYKDWHSGTIDNTPGVEIPPLPRNMVDDDFLNACSYGYHVGSWEYASTFNGGHYIVIVKVKPQNVVSVAQDASCGKIRVMHYEVLMDYKHPEPLKEPVYSVRGSVLEPTCMVRSANTRFDVPDNDSYDGSYEDDDEDEDDDRCPDCGCYSEECICDVDEDYYDDDDDWYDDEDEWEEDDDE